MAPLPRSASASASFPRGTYATYKRATSYFLRWLLRAQASGVGVDPEVSASTFLSSELHAYDKIVLAVARDPMALPPALLRKMPHALNACECAITLRKRVAAFFGDAADAMHAHFLARMTAWWAALTDAFAASTTDPTGKRTDFSNYYDVLRLPEEYFDDDENASGEGARGRRTEAEPLRSEAHGDESTGDEFTEDFFTELACMIMELEELNEAVYAAFHDVKTEKKTLLEAAVVSKVAIDCAGSVIAAFQLRHSTNPHVVDARTLSMLLKACGVADLEAEVQTAWKPSKEVRYAYCPGTLLIDILEITRALAAFHRMWVGRGYDRFQNTDPIFDQVYDEETTQEWMVPDWSSLNDFFMSYLPRACNCLHDLSAFNITKVHQPLESQLLNPLKRFLDAGEISIHFAFMCSCWVRSVAALQGNNGLRQTVSASFMHMYDVKERLTMSMTQSKAKTSILDKIQMMAFVAPLMRSNPVLAGYVLLDHQLRYLQLGSDELMLVEIRALSHIYSALRNVRLLDEIPLLEETIGVYEASLFTPSRAAATHGTFARSFLASLKLMLASVYLQYGKGTASKPGHTRSIIDKGRLTNLSRVVGLIKNSDLSFLPAEASSSWTSLLSAVSTVCREELFDSRLLSRDALRLFDDVPKVCLALRDQLGRRSHSNHVAGTSATNHTLENAIVFPLLPMLDALDRNDVANVAFDRDDNVAGDVLLDAAARGSVRSRLAFCYRAASIIKRHFDRPEWVERNYFTITSSAAWVSVQYGSTFSRDVAEPDSSVVVSEFNDLLRILQTSRGPLRGQQLDSFKHRVISAPAIIAMVSLDPTLELRTLFHHAAAGLAHDIQLVEWLIQMGALEHDARCFRDKRINALAVHCAAKRGYQKIAEHIVEAGNFRDIDTKTHHTKESIAELTLKSDGTQLWAYLRIFGADMTGVDAPGRRVWEHATDREIRNSVRMRVEEDHKQLEQSRSRRTTPSKPAGLSDKKISPSFHSDGLTATPGAPPISEAGDSALLSTDKATKSKRKRRKKSKKSKEAHAQIAGSHVVNEQVGEAGEDECCAVEPLSTGFEKLLSNEKGSPGVKARYC